MKKVLFVTLFILLCLCSCKSNRQNIANNPENTHANTPEPVTETPLYEIDERIVKKWVDVKTEKIHEYTDDGYYYEYINENFTYDKTRYFTQNGKIYYYLDGDTPDMSTGIAYEFNGENLIIAGELEYKPLNIKTSIEEMEQE